MKRLVAIIILIVIFLFFIINLSDLYKFIFNKHDTGTGLLLYDQNNLKNKVSLGYIHKNSKEFPVKNLQEVYYGDSNKEDGAANIVTSIVVGYRAFDTLGEITVLFIAIAGVVALFGNLKHSYNIINQKPNFVLEQASRFLLPLIVVFGLYIIIHGHLTPGGGFQGGSIIATAALLYFLSKATLKYNNTGLVLLETLSGSFYVLTGILAIILMGYFLGNFLSTGKIGNLVSAGILPILYFFIGIKVSGELSSTLLYFMDKGE